MNHKSEPGLEHIKKLGITPAPNAQEIYELLSKKYSYSKAGHILDDIYNASSNDHPKLYDKKNANYDVAMIFSGSYDANIIRNACNWISEHPEYFGDVILEIGCDCGFMTTFLGSFFPQKKIIAIDRNESGIKIAKENVKKFDLTNVTFLNTDVVDLKEQKFDSVFSMRTLHENSLEEKEAQSTELIDLGNMYTEITQDYASALSSLVKESGTLISFERMGIDSLFLGWIKALINVNMEPVVDSFKEIQCNELDDLNYFEAMIYTKKNPINVNAIDIFEQCFYKCIDNSKSKYEDWDAKVMYALVGGEPIKGYEATFTKLGKKSRVIICKHKEKRDCILFYQNRTDKVTLELLDISKKEETLKSLSYSLKQAKSLDCIINEF